MKWKMEEIEIIQERKRKRERESIRERGRGWREAECILLKIANKQTQRVKQTHPYTCKMQTLLNEALKIMHTKRNKN